MAFLFLLMMENIEKLFLMAFGAGGDFETAKYAADANGLGIDFLYCIGKIKNSLAALENAVNSLKRMHPKYRYLSISIGGHNCADLMKNQRELTLIAAQSVFNKHPLRVDVEYWTKDSRKFAECVYNRLPAFTIPMQIYFSPIQCEQVNFNPFKGYTYEF